MSLICKNGTKECDGCMRCLDEEIENEELYCYICGRPIRDRFFQIDGENYCVECAEDEFMRYI